MTEAGRPVVTLYGRPGCHLCDEAETLLRDLAERLGFELVLTDIESDDALLERYVFDIPVITVHGDEIARAPISPRTLEATLAATLQAAR